MKIPPFKIKPLCSALILASLLTACGGGGGNTNNPQDGSKLPDQGQLPGGSQPPAGNPPPPSGNTPSPGDTPSSVPLPDPVPASAPMTMSCVEGTGYQCSGGSVIRSDNGVALTSSGVQVYGKSTSDLVAGPDSNPTIAYGLAPASGGVAEFRLTRDDKGVTSNSALLLNNLGISWDGQTERPQIIEVFQPTYGRSELVAGGMINGNVPLPDNTHTEFYDYANYLKTGVAANQSHYANNRYFPRDTVTKPARCPTDMKPDANGKIICDVETTGPRSQPGDWRNAGTLPDWVGAIRFHEDGDVHAGDDLDGKPLPGGSGPGVPFAGSKGYRDFANWSFQYSNLGTWLTQDTVKIVEWTRGAGSDEHSQNRRGVVAFGDVTNPAAVPATGSATYSGIAYGWYGNGNTAVDPDVFWGAATATVNFATREVTVVVENTVTYNDARTPLPVAFNASAKMGAAGQSVANYLTGPVNAGTLKGGVSGRYFGPADATNGPPEVGGAFTLSNSTTGQTVVGGFIARKRQ